MIDPWCITKYDRTYEELQEFLIFCRIAAGKNASFAAIKTNALVTDTLVSNSAGLHDDSFEYMRYMNDDALMEALVQAKVGNYKVTFDFCRAVQGYSYAALQTASRKELLKLPGIGPKTASFFIAHSRKDARVAVLDRHILRWLWECGHTEYRYTNTPQDIIAYELVEQDFLAVADRNEETPAELDLRIWTQYANKETEEYGRILTGRSA